MTAIEKMIDEDGHHYFCPEDELPLNTLGQAVYELQFVCRGVAVVSRTPGGLVVHRIFSRKDINGL